MKEAQVAPAAGDVRMAVTQDAFTLLKRLEEQRAGLFELPQRSTGLAQVIETRGQAKIIGRRARAQGKGPIQTPVGPA